MKMKMKMKLEIEKKRSVSAFLPGFYASARFCAGGILP